MRALTALLLFIIVIPSVSLALTDKPDIVLPFYDKPYLHANIGTTFLKFYLDSNFRGGIKTREGDKTRDFIVPLRHIGAIIPVKDSYIEVNSDSIGSLISSGILDNNNFGFHYYPKRDFKNADYAHYFGLGLATNSVLPAAVSLDLGFKQKTSIWLMGDYVLNLDSQIFSNSAQIRTRFDKIVVKTDKLDFIFSWDHQYVLDWSSSPLVLDVLLGVSGGIGWRM